MALLTNSKYCYRKRSALFRNKRQDYSIAMKCEVKFFDTTNNEKRNFFVSKIFIFIFKAPQDKKVVTN